MERNDIAVSLAQDALLDWFMQIYCSNFKEDPGVLDMAFRLPPEDAIEYLKSKGMKITWSWKDMEKEAHAKSFTVAKAMKTDILTSIKDHLQKALEEGWSFDRFQKTLAPGMQKKGWWGKVPDELVPSDGSIHAGGKIVQLGSAWRLKTIFATNVQSAMMAGRYKAMSATTATRPYWQYLAVMDASTRPDHARLHGRVFRHDDPIWQKIFPPNGFNCRCSVRSLSDRDLKNKGLSFSVEESKNGQIFDDKGQPIEPDPGFDYNPGLVGAEQLEAIAKAKQEQLQRDLARAKKTTEPAKPQSVSLRPTKPEEDVFVPVDKYGLDEEIPPQDVPSLKAWEARQAELKAKADAEAKAAMEKLQARLAEKAKKEEEAKAKAVVDKEKKKVQAIVRKMPNGKELDDLFDEIDLHDAEPTWNMDNVKNSPRYGGVVFNDKGQILLRRPTNDFDGYVWTFAKGGADGQKPLKAAKREVFEETGTEATAVGYLEGGFGPQKNNFFFVMKAGKHDPTKMDKETQDMKWVSPKEAVEHIMKTTNEKGRERDLKVLASAVRTWNGIASGKITYDHLKPKPVETPSEVESGNPLLKPGIFPDETKNLKVIQTLGGSTGAKLVEDPATGKKYVMKKGANQGHLREEVAADEIYRSMNVLVPACRLYETDDGPVKLSEYMEGARPLAEVMGKPGFDKVKAQLQKGFAADALLGNWDVVGMGFDNVLVDKDGNAWRIDNGGSLRYRAQGKQKSDHDWNEFAGELWTLRGKAWHTIGSAKTDLWTSIKNADTSNTAKIFGDLGIVEISKQVDAWDVEKILEKVPADLKAIVRGRIENMKAVASRSLDFSHDRWKDDYIDNIAQGSMALRKYGLPESLPKALKNSAGDVYVYDEDGKMWDKLIQKASSDSSASSSSVSSPYGNYKASVAAAKVAVTPPKLTDKYFAVFVDALKTISHHNDQGDSQYNLATINKALELAKVSLASESPEMQKHYKAVVDYLTAAQSHVSSGKGAFPTIGRKMTIFSVPDEEQPPVKAKPTKDEPATERIMALAKDLGWDMQVITRWQKSQAGNSWAQGALIKKYHAFVHGNIDSSEIYWGDHKGTNEEACRTVYRKALQETPTADLAMTLHHAAIQELLEKTDFRFNDKIRRCVRIIRTENKRDVIERYSLKKGSSAVFKRGLNESGSVLNTTCVCGSEITLTAVPYSRITGIYFWESPLAQGSTAYLGADENEFTHSAPDIPALYVKGSVDKIGGKSEGRDASEWGVSLSHLRGKK